MTHSDWEQCFKLGVVMTRPNGVADRGAGGVMRRRDATTSLADRVGAVGGDGRVW
jgi:hypothetical protein